MLEQVAGVLIAVLAAIGGTGGVVQLIKAIRDWRAGVAQRDAAPTARLVAYLEGEVAVLKDKVAVLEAAREVDGAYTTLLVFTMASNGLPVPARPAYGGKPT